jgi:hypothetical protein
MARIRKPLTEEQKEARAISQKKYRDNNKEAVVATRKRHYDANKEVLNIAVKKWREENREDLAISKKKYYEDNKEATAIYMKKYRNENKEAKWESSIKRNYGIDASDYEEMMVKQEGKCSICKEVCSSNKRLSVDHCHLTGKVRGLLCSKCNTAIGLLKDDVALLSTATEYLKLHKGE